MLNWHVWFSLVTYIHTGVPHLTKEQVSALSAAQQQFLMQKMRLTEQAAKAVASALTPQQLQNLTPAQRTQLTLKQREVSLRLSHLLAECSCVYMHMLGSLRLWAAAV